MLKQTSGYRSLSYHTKYCVIYVQHTPFTLQCQFFKLCKIELFVGHDLRRVSTSTALARGIKQFSTPFHCAAAGSTKKISKPQTNAQENKLFGNMWIANSGPFLRLIHRLKEQPILFVGQTEYIIF